MNYNSILFKVFLKEIRIAALCHNIDKAEVRKLIERLVGQHIVGICGIRVSRQISNHAANHEVRIDFLGVNNGFCRSNKLIVDTVPAFLFVFSSLSRNHAESLERSLQRHIDFVKGHPIFYLILITGEQAMGILAIDINQFSIRPAAIFFPYRNRRIKMGNCNERFNMIFQALINHRIIERQSRRIRLFLLQIWEQSCDRNGEAKNLEAHFCKELDVPFVGMIEVNAPTFRIIRHRSSFGFINHFLSNICLTHFLAFGRINCLNDFRKSHHLSILIPSTLGLTCRNSATPKEILTESH